AVHHDLRRPQEPAPRRHPGGPPSQPGDVLDVPRRRRRPRRRAALRGDRQPPLRRTRWRDGGGVCSALVMARPLLVVGDVQGDSERLDTALRPYPEADVDTVFLGDFFQGGPPGEGGGARAARIARSRRNARAVLGNHDLMLLCVLEEVRTGWTPPQVADFGRSSLADVWLWRRGDWADLHAVDADPDLEAWLRSLPLMLRLDDGTLVQHCDDDAYARLGGDVDAVNAAAREKLQQPQGTWEVFWHTVGRRTFHDAGRLVAHLHHFDASRV